MKMYIDNRKNEDVYERAMTIYTNRGKLLYSDTGRIKGDDLKKFDKTLIAIEKSVKQFRKLSQNGILSETEPLLIFIGSKTIYNWLDKENCPAHYVDVFAAIMFELSLLTNETEIIYSKTTKALYKSTEEKEQKVTDLFK